MNRITVGLSKPRKWSSIFSSPEIFIEIPVARNVCISSYLLQISDTGTNIRLADRFYEDNAVIFSKALAISHQKEIELIDWGKTQAEENTIDTVGLEVLNEIIGFKKTKKNHFLNTKDPYNLIKILHDIGEEKVRYSWLNFFKEFVNGLTRR